jgi:hypothetical protein
MTGGQRDHGSFFCAIHVFCAELVGVESGASYPWGTSLLPFGIVFQEASLRAALTLRLLGFF